ncbi:niemann-Pick type C-related protein 1 [Vanrija albida]|uniref:Niemann-Pick type C-related protein 1 n=1 Tax=Vanrija albida TaxID=181172 RepID=A0ABR3PW38_9TREE
MPPSDGPNAPGVCAMRGSCGRASMFGAELPCPDHGQADKIDDEIAELLRTTCGPAWTLPSHVCCTTDQVRTLSTQLQQAAPLIASCPACVNNFRAFYCDFTCSPDQSTFMAVTSTQRTTDGRQAVKSIDYAVSEEFASAFFTSCKDVQFGATNGFAMDLIGGGAKNASAFLKYMGDVRPGLGSPFQIDFPYGTNYSRNALSCGDSDINARCACADCPDVCPVLPHLPPPGGPGCRVGAVSCVTFALLMVYSAAILAGLLYYSFRTALRHRQRRYERVALVDPPLSPTVGGLDGLVGRGSGDRDDADSGPSGSVHFRLGRGASLLDPMEHLQPKQNQINAILRRFFYRLGLVCARRPLETFGIAAVVIAALNIGWRFFAVETDPVRLWVSPSSEAAEQKAFFDENFGPFYRTEQVIITRPDGGNVLSYDTLDWWLKTEAEINALASESGITYADVCFAPSGRGTPCVIQSLSAWLGDDMAAWGDKWPQQVELCARRPGECLPDFGQPIEPKMVLGGAGGDWLNAKAIFARYVVQNYDDERVRPAEEWERTLEAYLATLAHDGLKISYSTEVSLGEELNKSTNTDVKIVVLSYLVMFLYISLTLGGSLPPHLVSGTAKTVWYKIKLAVHSLGLIKTAPVEPIGAVPLSNLPTTLLIQSKFSLGLFGIAIVLIAVTSSVGLFSLLGVRVTLIIAEVIPFLVLAVGVDNVFILVHELERQNALYGPTGAPPPASTDDEDDDLLEDELNQRERSILPAEERVARAVARMGPSILLSSTTEVVAFALGAFVPMPAVRNFAIYAAGSVFLGAVMQVTVFVSAMVIDLRRSQAMRMDCLPCIRLRQPVGLYDEPQPAAEGAMTRFIRRVYAPFLLKSEVKQLVLAAFGGLFLLAVVGIQRISLGLDQRLALPSDSYLVPYFNDLDKYNDVGPPVYFVVKDGDPASRSGQQELCERFTTCADRSVANMIEAERKRPNVSFLANPPASWIDDFLQWTNPAFESCCRVRRRDPSVFCRPRDSDRLCRPCFEDEEWDSTMNGLPEGANFTRYLSQWLVSPADESCPLGGMQGYSTAISRAEDSTVTASHFRTFHTALRKQSDFISSLAAARRIAGEIARSTGLDVYPYSLFYVYFDQYSYIRGMTAQILIVGLAAVLVITSVLLGSWMTGGTVTFTCALAVINVMGVMGFWGVSLNAISLVNLVISLGIAVEFCSHIARAFMGAGTGLLYDKLEGRKERDERVWTALVDVGPSVFSGITLTKLIGISVLALTRSRLLEIYYFRMWLSLIVSGALHGLVLLPVLLSFTGGAGYSLEDTDEDWVTSQMRRPMDYEYAPFADDDSMMD